MKSNLKKIGGIFFCLLLVVILVSGQSVPVTDNDPAIIGHIPGPGFPTPVILPTVPPVVPPTEDEFKWIPNVPIKDVKIFLDVNSTLISNEMVEVCWKYPDGFESKAPDEAKKFEAIFFEEPTSSEAPTKDFKLAFEADASKPGWKSKCVPIQATPPTVQTAYFPTADFGGQLYPGYSKIDPNASNGLNRRTLVVSGYYSNSAFVPANFKMGREIVYFAVGSDNKGYSGTISLAIVQNADGTESEVWVSTQTPLGISFQKSARTAAKIAQEMNSDLPRYSYFFKIADERFGSVDGPSAGAAMTVLASKTLKKEAIKKNVGITGTIAFDGKIGRIGGVNAKASAANSLGTADKKFTFLVPTNQKNEITTPYPNIESKEVANIQGALNEFQTTEEFKDAGFLLGAIGSRMNALIWGIAPKIVDKRTVKSNLKFSSISIAGTAAQNIAVRPLALSTAETKPFELALDGIDKTKPLILAFGSDVSCEDIARWVNDGKLTINQKWLQKATDFAKDTWTWAKGFLGNNAQVQEGVQKINRGEWLSGGAQIGGAELGRLIVGTAKGLWGIGKGVVITVYEGGKALVKEIQQDVGKESVPAGSQGTTEGIDVTKLVSQETTRPTKYLVVNATTNKIYPIGNLDWNDGRNLEPLWLVRQIDGKDVNPTNFSDGKTVRFTACQYETVTQGEKAVQQVSAKDSLDVQFGQVSCTSLLDCLAKIDLVFINRLFGS